MSHDDQYYEDDYDEDDYEDMDYEEGICGQADDLAEHTMPSPVYLDDDITLNIDDALDDWLLYGTDDYFDQQHSRKRKRGIGGAGEQAVTQVLGAGNDQPSNTPAKGQKPDVSSSSSNAPIVNWRNRRHEPLSYPVFEQGTGIQVAILKDWRTKSEVKIHRTINGAKLNSEKRAFAVVIERRRSEDLDKRLVLPDTDVGQAALAKKVAAKPRVNATATTESSRAKKQDKHETAVDPPQRPALAQNGKSVTTPTPKLKAMDLDEEEDELQADYGEVAQPKKRTIIESKRAAPKQSNGTVTLSKGRKRKAIEPEPEASTRPAKRRMARPKAPSAPRAENVKKGKTEIATVRSTRKNN